jgi:hypothetical protein
MDLMSASRSGVLLVVVVVVVDVLLAWRRADFVDAVDAGLLLLRLLLLLLLG